MKKLLKVGAVILAIMLISTGCSNNESSEPEAPETPPEVLYPVSIDGNEIILGETTVQTLLDLGLNITVSEMTPDKKINKYEIDPDAVLDSNSYYSGASIWISEKVAAHIAMVTDEEAIRMGDAVIARLEFLLISAEPETLERIAFNKVPLNELSKAKAEEMFPDFTSAGFTLIQYGLDYDYGLDFDQETNVITKLSLKKEYDIDWTTKK